ncbi:MAG: glycosyltransferase family 4 protein [Acidobacteria bacterium]|nr:glycosyltransferase family 4 protein [Acidobacteriota bacterium]
MRVLLVPDSTYWVTGTIAKSIARFNPWVDATIASWPVINEVFAEQPELMHNFDLVHFVCPYASRAWLPRFRELIPCVTSHHHVTDWEIVKHNLEGDAIVVGSEEWADDLHKRGAQMDRVFCVPYGVDAEQFRPATVEQRAAIRKKLGISNDATVVGFFAKKSSNDDDRKGTDIFIKALTELRSLVPKLTALIIGPGWDEMVRAFRAAGIRCLWFPFIRDNQGLAQMYSALDFYWVTARVEGGPVTLLEAMSSEVCCLTTPVGLARDLVSDGDNAILLPFNDTDGFVQRTAALAGDSSERQRLGRRARQTILQHMHVGVTTQRVKDVYARAMEIFANRQQCAVPVDVRQLAAHAPQHSPVEAAKRIPLHGFPSALHRYIEMLETLAWSEHLVLYQRQRAVAFKLIMREWLSHPFSAQPGRVLLRRFLPDSLVAGIVKIKNGSRADTLAATPQRPSDENV